MNRQIQERTFEEVRRELQFANLGYIIARTADSRKKFIEGYERHSRLKSGNHNQPKLNKQE